MRVPDKDGLMPRFYGVAFRDAARRESICYPVPFNWVVRWYRSLSWWVKGFQTINKQEKDLAMASHLGYKRGYEEGHRQLMLETLKKNLETVLEEKL